MPQLIDARVIIVISHGWCEVAGQFTQGWIRHRATELGIGVVAHGMEGDLAFFPFPKCRFFLLPAGSVIASFEA